MHGRAASDRILGRVGGRGDGGGGMRVCPRHALVRLAEHTILDLNIRIIFICIRIYAYVRMLGHPQMEISLLRAPN